MTMIFEDADLFVGNDLKINNINLITMPLFIWVVATGSEAQCAEIVN